MLSFTTPRGRIAYDREGQGPLVLCVPGLGDTRAQFRALVPRLVASGRTVVTLDPPGHGDSDVPAHLVTPDDVGRDVLALVESLGVDRVLLVGNSAGAASVVWAAAELGARCEGLLLLGPVVRDGMPIPAWLAGSLVRVLGTLLGNRLGASLWTWWYRRLYVAGTPPDHEAHVAKLHALTAQPGRFRAALGFGAMPKAACAARAPEVTAPTLALLGAADPDYPDVEAEAAWLRDALHAEALVLPATGHYPHLEDPEGTWGHIARFLAARIAA